MAGGRPRARGGLTLAPHPTSARAARSHVGDVLGQGPLSGLVETAQLLVSEVVTNAVLHAATDIELSCRVERGSVWVDVRDRSPLPPTPRHYDGGAMTGRGLHMVEQLADAWGVDADEQGKTVWFQLAGPDLEPAETRIPPAETRIPPAEAGSPPASFDVHLQNLPVDLVLATIQYGDAVLRELALVSIASDPAADGRTARPTSRIDLGPLLTQVGMAQRAGHRSVDLVVGFPQGSGVTALERLALVDEADRMARDGNLLTLPAVPEIGLCRRWLYSQIGLQAEGGAAVGWRMPEPPDPVVGPAWLPDEVRRRLDLLTQGAILADDANRILYVNDVAAAVLGWEPEHLVGRRLVSIVPPDHRAAHLAGFTRYLLTGEAHLLGQRVRLPALRRDGSVLEVDITIDVVDLGGRMAFRAVLG